MKTLASTLKEGESYLHSNGMFIRTIIFLNPYDVEYRDAYNRGACSKAHFARTCPTVATEEDIHREIEWMKEHPVTRLN